MWESIIKSWENWRWTVTAKPAEFSDLTRWTPEAQDIQRRYEQEKKQIKTETKNNLEKEKIIHQAREIMYWCLWIKNDLNENPAVTNYLKWMIDWLIIWNIDLAIETYNTNWKILFEAFKTLMSIDWIKATAKVLWENIGDIFTWNSYEKWKSSVELILIWTWIAGTFKLAKFLIKWAWKVAIKAWTVWQGIIRSWAEVVKDFSSLSIKDILKLWKSERVVAVAKLADPKRLEIAYEFLKTKFNQTQKIAILEAHKIWDWWINNYSLEEILKKARILKIAWFESKEIRILMEEWVCWSIAQVENPTIWKKLLWIFENEKPVKISQTAEAKIWIPNFQKNLVNILEMKNGFAENIKLAEWMEWIQRFDNFLTIEYFISWHEIATRITQALEELWKYIIRNRVAILKNPEYMQQVILSLKWLRARLAYISENWNQVSPIILRRLWSISWNELTEATNVIHTKLAPKI